MLVEGILGDVYCLSVALFHDFMAAFPRADHDFAYISMERQAALYTSFRACQHACNDRRRGRGGPMPSFWGARFRVLFSLVWVFERLCSAFSGLRVLLRACVDDVGAVVRSVDHFALA